MVLHHVVKSGGHFGHHKGRGEDLTVKRVTAGFHNEPRRELKGRGACSRSGTLAAYQLID